MNNVELSANDQHTESSPWSEEKPNRDGLYFAARKDSDIEEIISVEIRTDENSGGLPDILVLTIGREESGNLDDYFQFLGPLPDLPSRNSFYCVVCRRFVCAPLASLDGNIAGTDKGGWYCSTHTKDELLRGVSALPENAAYGNRGNRIIRNR